MVASFVGETDKFLEELRFLLGRTTVSSFASVEVLGLFVSRLPEGRCLWGRAEFRLNQVFFVETADLRAATIIFGDGKHCI
ncbi:hypothetical protein ACOWPH_17720 [Anabaena sp. PCC 7938]|uniref:hypothetical protein n=1 Tax=Anabaena sp. PCC 7938 TaxID=1296340 RepID=UPI0003060E9A